MFNETVTALRAKMIFDTASKRKTTQSITAHLGSHFIQCHFRSENSNLLGMATAANQETGGEGEGVLFVDVHFLNRSIAVIGDRNRFLFEDRCGLFDDRAEGRVAVRPEIMADDE